MFQINAIIKPSVLDDVLQGLVDEGILGVTVTNVIGKGYLASTNSKLIEKVMLIIVVADTADKEKAMEAVRSNAQDIEHGAGKMWVTSVIEAERIRTGEKDVDALSLTSTKSPSYIVHDEDFNAIDTPAS